MIGNSRSIHQLSTSGSDRRRSVSAVGAQSTTMTSHSPERAWADQIGQGEDLLQPREQRELLGLDRPHAGEVEQLGQVGAQITPLLLQPLAGVELLGVQALRAPATGRPPSRRSRASASEWAGSVESTSVR